MSAVRTNYYLTIHDGPEATIALDLDGEGHLILVHSIDGTKKRRISTQLYELMRKELGDGN